MKILDTLDREIQESEVDLELGYLVPEQLFVKHHDEIPEQPEEFHYECRTFYFEDDTSLDVSTFGNEDPHVKIISLEDGVFEYVDQGEGKIYRGLDIAQVTDKERVEAKEAWDEYEDIQRYKLYTQEELEANRLAKEQAEKQRKFMDQGPDVLKETAEITVENSMNIDDLNMLLADLIGV